MLRFVSAFVSDCDAGDKTLEKAKVYISQAKLLHKKKQKIEEPSPMLKQ